MKKLLLILICLPLLFTTCKKEDETPVAVAVPGCMDQLATNYNPEATVDDGLCCYIAGCTDSTMLNYNPNACYDDGSCVPLYQSCINTTGEWEINPSCPYYEVLGIQIDVEERFNDYMFVVCDSNKLNIDFGSDQTAYAEIDITGQLIIPNQIITLDFQNEGYGFIDVDIYGDGSVNTDIGIGVLNLTFVFEILPGSIDSTSCVLTIDKH